MSDGYERGLDEAGWEESARVFGIDASRPKRLAWPKALDEWPLFFRNAGKLDDVGAAAIGLLNRLAAQTGDTKP